MNQIREPESPWVSRLQLALLFGFSLFATAIVSWILRLIYISWVLQDIFSASIGIALVAIPVFLFLLIIFNYVFWGLLSAKDAEDSQRDPERTR